MKCSALSLSTLAILLVGFCSLAVQADEFYPISGVTVSTEAGDLWPASNLIQGPGVGFDANEPHDKILGGADGNWVTGAPGGFPSNFVEVAGAPIITLDLGGDVALNEIAVWGYSDSNSNGVKEFSLRFATSDEGTGGFGTSIAFNPSFTGLTNEDDISMFSFPFAEVVSARYVEFTADANFFIAPGDGSGGEIPGGDRVGIGEIAFPVPEPSTMVLALLGIVALAAVARRRR